jgi:hypothetical protein
MGRPKAARPRLEQAQHDHAEANKRIGRLETARIDALLADDDAKAAKLDAELEAQRRLARGHLDKVRLLEVQAEREAAAERVRRHEQHIRQVEKLGEGFVAAGTKLAAATAVLVEAYREAIAAADRRAAAWPWAPVDQIGAILTPAAVQLALAHEFHRTSRVPFLGGRPGERVVPSLPGAMCSRPTDWLNLPEKEPALVEVFKQAGEYASRRMRESVAQPDAPPPPANGNGNSNHGRYLPLSSAEPQAAAAVEPPALLPAPGTLGELLRRQAELAADMSPSGQAEYEKVVQQIAHLQ